MARNIGNEWETDNQLNLQRRETQDVSKLLK